jgi:hypothetical protein
MKVASFRKKLTKGENMKLITIFAFVLGMTQNVLADEPTIYSQINGFYNAGTEPQFEETMGWWSGRCYSVNNQNKPVGAMLAAIENILEQGGDNGPAFPPITRHFKNLFINVSGWTAPGREFDELNEDRKFEIARDLKSTHVMSMVAANAGGSLVSDSSSDNAHFYIRKNGDYFYGIISALTDSSEIKAGTAYGACYFFKKIN